MQDSEPVPLRAAQASKAEERSLGRILREAREEAGLSMTQVASELCIGAEYLTALEEDRLDAVGPRVFAKGYLKLYCEFIDLDFPRLLAMYDASTGNPEPILLGRRSIEQREGHKGRAGMLIGLAIALVIVLLIVWLLGTSAG